MTGSPGSTTGRAAGLVGASLAAGAVAVMALLAGPAKEASASERGHAPDGAHLVHTKCPPGVPADVGKIRCDFLVVPENHSHPNGPTIRLTIARIPASSSHPAPQPTVYLNGGPGSNAIAAAGDLISEGHLNKNREVIVVTQRGTYDAHPLLACRSVDNFRADSLDRKLYGRETGRRLDRAVNRCKKQLGAKGIHRADYTTLESTEDLVDLRRVLGIRSWDVFAHSYGTDLGLTYMRLHPQGIRSVVLDGTVPPSKASIGWTWTSFKEFFSNMLKACRAQNSCRQHFPHIGRTYIRLANRLQKNPVTTRVKVPDRDHRTKVKIDGGVLINWLTRQSHFTSTVPLEINQLAHGHPRRIARQWAEQRAVPREHRGIFGYGMGYTIWCGEWVPFQSKQKQMREGERVFPALRRSLLAQGPQLTLLRRICRNWNVPKAPSSIRDVTHSSIPTLAITGTFDAQTGAQWGSYAARTLPNSTVVNLPGVSHGAFANPCGASVINSFLLSPDAADTRCVRHVHPNRFVTKPPHRGRPSSGPASSEHIYWANRDQNTISEANLDGSDPRTLVKGPAVDTPVGVTVDGGVIYWANRGNNTIAEANLNGSGARILVKGPTLAGPVGLAVDASHKTIYWANNDDNSIAEANLDGGDAHRVLKGGTVQAPAGLALGGSHIYWANLNDTISVANLDGSGARTLVRGGGGPNSTVAEPAGLAVDGSHLYWANGRNNTIGKAGVDGSGARIIARGDAVDHPWGVDVHGGHLYWSNDAHDPTIAEADLDGGGTRTLVNGSAISRPRGVAIAPSQHIYWANSRTNTIAEASADGNGDRVLVDGPQAESPVGVAVEGTHIYWANLDGKISVANLDGSGARTLVSGHAVGRPDDVAVNGDHIYWANRVPGSIGVANLDGSGARTLIDGPAVDTPTGVAVAGSHIYWANRGSETIAEANLDGSGARTLLKGSTVAVPAGLAVDGDHIYWSNGDEGRNANKGNTIAVANLDGSGARILVKGSTAVFDPRGVLVMGDHIYWSNFNYDEISQANLDGDGAHPIVAHRVDGPWGLAGRGG